MRRGGLTRRQVLPLLAAPLLGLGRATAPRAAEPDLLDALYDLAWIPDGSSWQKHAYVITAPWCAACKQAYRESRALVSDVQLRWIPAGSDDQKWLNYNAALARSRDPRMLDELYLTGTIADVGAPGFRSADLNEGVLFARRAELERLLGRSYAYPTFVCRWGSEILARAGYSDELFDGLPKAVAPDERHTPDGSKSLDLLSRPVDEAPIDDHVSAVARDAIATRALPFQDAPLVDLLEEGEARGVAAEIETADGSWIALDYPRQRGSGRGLRTYVPANQVALWPKTRQGPARINI